VAQLTRFFQGQLQDPLGPGREGNFDGHKTGAAADDLLDLDAGVLEVDPIDLSTLAATPVPSPIKPSRICSVPTKLWPRRRASSWASMITLMAFSVNRSNMGRCQLQVIPTYQDWPGIGAGVEPGAEPLHQQAIDPIGATT
jgi:hypothetical protein